MLTMHPTLLVGPADWDAGRMPEQEFRARIAALFGEAERAAEAAIVYGNPAHHAELAYLTHFTPKLEAAIALIPRAGAIWLLVGGGPTMIQAAKPLSYVQDLVPLRNAGKAVAEWLRGLGSPGALLIGAGTMPPGLRREIIGALGEPAAWTDATGTLRALMRHKSACELGCLRAACATLDAAVAAMADAQRGGAGATAVILAGERAANRRGVQDVRTLFSLDGGCTLRPFETTVERAADPLQVYVAVRQFGYWAEGFALLAAAPHPGMARAGEILRSAAALVRPGMRAGEVARSIASESHPWQPHPVTARTAGNAIGLALEEVPRLAPESDDHLQPSEVYSLRAGLTDGNAQSAIASAMVAVHDHGSEVLWASPGAARP